MKENKDPLVYVGHIKEAIGKIREYLDGVDFERFSKDSMIFDAVVRELEIIGEASNRIEEDFQKNYPDIPWRKMVGMRNTIIHEYFGINKEVVWNTCGKSLDELDKIVSIILG